MTLPGFKAETSLYKTGGRYRSARASVQAYGLALQQLNVNPRPITVVSCDLAQALCIQSAQGSGYDPSGWCDWYEANCITAGPQVGGGGGGSCAPGCWQNYMGGCVCPPGGKRPPVR